MNRQNQILQLVIKTYNNLDNKSLTYNNQLTETESMRDFNEVLGKCEYKLTEGQFNTNKGNLKKKLYFD